VRHRTATIGTISMLITALAAVLVGATPAQAARVQTGVSTQAVTGEVRHTSITKTGGQVRERWVFHLDERAWVTSVQVYQSRGAVRSGVDLGWLSPGWHSWTWTGYDDQGKQAPDGYYHIAANVHFPGSPGWQPIQVPGRALVHRHYHPGYLRSQFPVLYPRSTTIHDSTMVENYERPFPIRATLRVRNRFGKVVFTRAVKALRTHVQLTWDGRDARGRVLPAGHYYAKISGVDMDGLRGSTEARKVVVSAKRLVAVTRTVTLSPSASITTYMDWRCSGCLDNPPPPPCGTVVASDRFTEEGALSYRSGTDPSCEPSRWSASTRNALTLDERAPRGGSTSVSVFGGPTTPGASDQGSLTVSGAASVLTGPDTSDHTTTTPWVPIVPGTPRTRWTFGTRDGSSYDAATFTVRVKFLTPRY
jgi:flagellar hook assembly protein FlgD